MRRFVAFVVAFGTALSVQGADAADIPVKAPPMAISSPNWAGFYVGLAGGYGWGRAEQTDSTPFSSGTYNTSGGLIGGTMGYNWQSGPIVYGLESDLSYAKISGSTIGTDPASGTCSPVGNPHCESTIDAFGTVRGHVGYAWNSMLPYVTGGLAYAKLHGLEGVTGTGGSGSSWVAGWTVGAGLEARFASNWSAKIEYLYVDLGDHKVFDDVFVGIPVPENVRTTVSIVRVGLNYRFGSL